MKLRFTKAMLVQLMQEKIQRLKVERDTRSTRVLEILADPKDAVAVAMAVICGEKLSIEHEVAACLIKEAGKLNVLRNELMAICANYNSEENKKFLMEVVELDRTQADYYTV